MSGSYQIGELARRAEVPVSTLRYYERAELLEPEGRTDGNYRVYGENALLRVRFIRVAQAAGFSLDDIATLLDLRDGLTAPCKEVEELIDGRLGEVRSRLKDLREVERHLKSFLEVCRKSAEDERCKVIDEIAAEASKS